MTTNDEQYREALGYYTRGRDEGYPLDPDLITGEGGDEYRAEFDRFLARVRQDAAREALNGLYEDASQEYHIGLQGDDQERMDAAEAVLRATYAWMDNYPEEAP